MASAESQVAAAEAAAGSGVVGVADAAADALGGADAQLGIGESAEIEEAEDDLAEDFDF